MPSRRFDRCLTAVMSTPEDGPPTRFTNLGITPEDSDIVGNQQTAKRATYFPQNTILAAVREIRASVTTASIPNQEQTREKPKPPLRSLDHQTGSTVLMACWALHWSGSCVDSGSIAAITLRPVDHLRPDCCRHRLNWPGLALTLPIGMPFV